MATLSGNAQIFSFDQLNSSTTKEHRYGTLARTTDGRAYRYAKAGGTNLVAGNLQQAPAPVANHVNQVIGADAAIGATEVTVTLGATLATADQYAEGYLVINDATGEGHSYLIKSHPAADSAADLVIQLEEPIKVALTEDTSEYTLVANPYNGTIISPTTETGPAVGAAPFAVDDGDYYWAQVHGVCSTLVEGTPGAGISVARSDNTAGAVEVGDGILQPVGTMVNTGVSGENNAVFLTID